MSRFAGPGRFYLEADIPAPLPHHLQLNGLPVASLPQFQPHFIIDVKQVMGVISGVVEHFLGQRSRMATEETFTNFLRSSNLFTLCMLRLTWLRLMNIHTFFCTHISLSRAN